MSRWVTCIKCRDQNHQTHLMPSHASQSQSTPPRTNLVRRGPGPFVSPPRTYSQPPKRSKLVRRVPATPPPTSPHQSDDEEDGDEESIEDDLNEEDPMHNLKRKRGCNSLQDALEEEVNRKKRKRGIIK